MLYRFLGVWSRAHKCIGRELVKIFATAIEGDLLGGSSSQSGAVIAVVTANMMARKQLLGDVHLPALRSFSGCSKNMWSRVCELAAIRTLEVVESLLAHC